MLRSPNGTMALSQIDRLRHLSRQLQPAKFGKRSEKLDPLKNVGRAAC
jgi:hypothetical protein